MDIEIKNALLTALEAVHNPRTLYQDRIQAQETLEYFKQQNDAAKFGWHLASRQSGFSNEVRHFGLSLIESSLVSSAASNLADTEGLANCPDLVVIVESLCSLALEISPEDPFFIREKIAFLFASLAKRFWGPSPLWSQFDFFLYYLYTSDSDQIPPLNVFLFDSSQSLTVDDQQQLPSLIMENSPLISFTRKDFVLSVFRTLLEDVFLVDDSTAAARSASLTAQSIEVITSQSVLSSTYTSRNAEIIKLKSSSLGWLNIWSKTLNDCLSIASFFASNNNNLNNSNNETNSTNTRVLDLAVQVLTTFKSVLGWVSILSIQESNSLDLISGSLASINDLRVKTLAVDCLYILFTRNFATLSSSSTAASATSSSSFSNSATLPSSSSAVDADSFSTSIAAVFSPQGIATLTQVYTQASSALDPNDIDDNIYIFLKKLVEIIVNLGQCLHSSNSSTKLIDLDFPNKKTSPSDSPTRFLPQNADIDSYLDLVLLASDSPSILISGLTLHLWTSLLRENDLFFASFSSNSHTLNSSNIIFNGNNINVTQNSSLSSNSSKAKNEFVINLQKQIANKLNSSLPKLLEIATKYNAKIEDLNEDSPEKEFLNHDFDTRPELQNFLNNIRQYMDDIARLIVCRDPFYALGFIKTRLIEVFESWEGWHPSSYLEFSKPDSPGFIYAYSSFSLVECSLRGLARWLIWYNAPDKDTKYKDLLGFTETWCAEIFSMDITDPSLLKKQVKTLVQFTPLLRKNFELMFKVLEKALRACTFDVSSISPSDPGYESVCELVKDVRSSCGTELNRLAYLAPDALSEIYEDLERVIKDISSSASLTTHEIVMFRSFLLVVSQRCSSTISPQAVKTTRFEAIVDPVLNIWAEPDTERALTDLSYFMERMGLWKIGEYFASRGVTINESASSLLATQMDETGKLLRVHLRNEWMTIFPVRPTRIFIQYSIERLSHSSDEFKMLYNLWLPRARMYTTHLLQLLTQINSFHNPSNWSAFPPAVQSFIRQTATERYWQVGVSTQSHDEFVKQSEYAAGTLRDFADSLGYIIRYTREYAFLALSSISLLENTLYDIPRIHQLLLDAFVHNASTNSLHTWKHMTSLVIKPIVKNCPAYKREAFYSKFLPDLFNSYKEYLVEKWREFDIRGSALPENMNVDVDIDTDAASAGLDPSSKDDNSALSKEMMEEYFLRQLTEIVAKMCSDLLSPLARPSALQTPVTIEKGHDARTVCISLSLPICPALISLLCAILPQRDARASHASSSCLLSIIPAIIGRSNSLDEYLWTNVGLICLYLLSNPYFTDSHSNAGYIFTAIYVVLRKAEKLPISALAEISAELQNYIASKQSLEEDKIKLQGSERQGSLKSGQVNMQQFSRPAPITKESILELEKDLLLEKKSFRTQRGLIIRFLQGANVFGPSTAGSLNDIVKSKSARAIKIRAERSRWLPTRVSSNEATNVVDSMNGQDLQNLFNEGS